MKVRQAANILVLGAAAAMLGGCQAWNDWLDMFKWKEPGLTQVTTQPIRTPITPPKIDDETARRLAAQQNPQVMVYRINLPVGTFSRDEKVWRQLDENAVDSATFVMMAQNGLRAGIGKLAQWENVRKIIDVPGADTQQITAQTDGRSSLNVTTRQNVERQIVVSIDKDNQQQARTFDACDNGFRLAMRLTKPKAGEPQQMIVQLEPIVTTGTVTVVRDPLNPGVVRTGFTAEETFADMRMATAVTAEQFLVVCPANPKDNKFSIGTLWLSQTEAVPPTETVLVFVPVKKQ